eukprot:s30_g10.t1
MFIPWILLGILGESAGLCEQDHFAELGHVMKLVHDHHTRHGGSVYRYFKTILQVSTDTSGEVDQQDFFDVALAAIFDYNTDFFEECFPGLIFTVFQSFFHNSAVVANPVEHFRFASVAYDFARHMWRWKPAKAETSASSVWSRVSASVSEGWDFLSWQYQLSVQQMAVTADLFRPVFVDETSSFASLLGPGRGGRQTNQQQILQPEDLPAVSKLICLEYFCEPKTELFQSVLASGILPYLGGLAIRSSDDEVLSRIRQRVEIPVYQNCKESDLPYILGPADDWRLLPMHISRLLLSLTATVEGLLTSSVSAVSMRHHILDATSNANHLRLLLTEQENAFSVANLAPVYELELETETLEHDSLVFLRGNGESEKGHLWGKSKVVRLAALMQSFQLADSHGDLRAEELNVSVSKCGTLRCFFVGGHAFSELPMQDIYLFRRQDSFTPPNNYCQSQENDWQNHRYMRGLAHNYGIPRSQPNYKLLAQSVEGLFMHESNEVLSMAYYLPVASMVHLELPQVQFIPVDFFGPCREQHGWLLVDLLQSLQLVLLQGLQHVTLVEPLLADVPHDMRCLNQQWMTTPELMSRLVENTWDQMKSVPFRDFFDIGHFRSEVQKFSVDETVEWNKFQETEGVIDTLFLLNDVALRGGLVTLGSYRMEPILHCEDRPDFNQEVGIYNDSKVLVRRLICLQDDAPNMLDMEKFRVELRNALAEPSSGARGHRLAFQLYNWNGLERLQLQGMDLGKAAQANWLPSMWSVIRFSKSLLWLADRVVQRMNRSAEQTGQTWQPEDWRFKAAHLRWRNFSQQQGNIPYKHPSREHEQSQKLMAGFSGPDEYADVLRGCVPHSLHCSDVFLMTNLPRESQVLADLRESYAVLCGQAQVHSITDELLPSSDIHEFFERSEHKDRKRSKVWSKLHDFFLEVAIATRANYFLGYGSAMGTKASAVSMITSRLRTFDGRGYWCTSWAFDPYCEQRGTRATSGAADALSYSC